MEHPDLSPPSTSCSYTGDARTLTRRGARWFLLTLCTLGLYFPWSWQQARAFIWPHIRIGGLPLQWTGTQAQQIKAQTTLGKLVAVACIASAAVNFYDRWAGATLGRAGLLSFATFVALKCLDTVVQSMVQLLSYRYELGHTRLAGVPFVLNAEPSAYARIYVRGSLVAWVTLGVRYGTFAVRTRRYLIDRARWGVVPARYTGDEKEANRLYVLGGLACICSLGAYLPWHIAKIRAYHARHTSIGALNLRSTQEGAGLSKVWLKCMAVWLCSLGFASGYASHMMLRYTFENLHLDGPPEALKQPVLDETEYPAPEDGLVDTLSLCRYSLM